MTILEKDIDVWTAFVENHTRELRNCSPNLETSIALKLDAAEQVLAALKDYQSVLVQA